MINHSKILGKLKIILIIIERFHCLTHWKHLYYVHIVNKIDID